MFHVPPPSMIARQLHLLVPIASTAAEPENLNPKPQVTIPNDHFGPIGPEHDPTRNLVRGSLCRMSGCTLFLPWSASDNMAHHAVQGVLVGESWKDRLDCRQWGAHFPHVAGIAGQSNMGSQSVVLSGGYEDDRDEGEWFLYTGSGGRDLSGNKRTSKVGRGIGRCCIAWCGAMLCCFQPSLLL